MKGREWVARGGWVSPHSFVVAKTGVQKWGTLGTSL